MCSLFVVYVGAEVYAKETELEFPVDLCGVELWSAVDCDCVGQLLDTGIYL